VEQQQVLVSERRGGHYAAAVLVTPGSALAQEGAGTQACLRLFHVDLTQHGNFVARLGVICVGSFISHGWKESGFA
jgi:hypothetical protein